MNDRDRRLALAAAVTCAEVMLEYMEGCTTGAMQGVDATREEAQRDHDADVAA